MKFKIKSEIFEKFPGLSIGAVIAEGIDNHGQSAELLGLVREKEKEIREKYDIESLSQQPRIESWRKAYAAFGAKPSKYRSSVESLYRMILKGMNLRQINKVVDIYNYISLKHMIPAGGDDRIKVEGDIRLIFARGGEPFIAFNSTQKELAEKGEVIYVDDREVLCRRWNWRECDKTKMTEETSNVVLVIESLPPVTEQAVQFIVADLGELVKRYCGGDIRAIVLNQANREVEI